MLALPPSLDPKVVTRAVLLRHPRLGEMQATARAMLAQFPVVTASPNPSVEVGIGPLSLPTGRGQRLSLRQPFSWTGRLEARGASVLAEVEAMVQDREAMAQMLVASAHEALVELAVSGRMRAIFSEHHQLMETWRRAVLARVSAGQGKPEDAVMAESEVVMADRELIRLDAMATRARAMLAVLMHESLRDKTWEAELGALPPRPPDLSVLISEAHAKRPELMAASARIAAREEDEKVAASMGKPMVSVGVEVSTMAEDPMMWPMLMVMVEFPWSSSRRQAMQDEARAMTEASRFSKLAKADEIESEVALRRSMLEAALDGLKITRESLRPTLVRRLELVRASFASGRGEFEDVITAQKALLEADIEGLELEREAHMAAIGLEFALGRLVRGGLNEGGRVE